MLENSIHEDLGTRNVLGFLRNCAGFSMQDAMGFLLGFYWVSMREFLFERPQECHGILKEVGEDFVGILKGFKWMLRGVCKVPLRILQGSGAGF